MPWQYLDTKLNLLSVVRNDIEKELHSTHNKRWVPVIKELKEDYIGEVAKIEGFYMSWDES
jgi:hypothetical protein